MSQKKNVPMNTCTRDEAAVLSMIKVWPDIPAIVTYSRESGWFVSTSPEDVERRCTQMRSAI